MQQKRRENRDRLVSLFGGKCIRCGFADHPSAFDFHHIDPSTKEISSSLAQMSLKYEKVEKEAAKCIMVCANCHREIHARLSELQREPT